MIYFWNIFFCYFLSYPNQNENVFDEHYSYADRKIEEKRDFNLISSENFFIQMSHTFFALIFLSVSNLRFFGLDSFSFDVWEWFIFLWNRFEESTTISFSSDWSWLIGKRLLLSVFEHLDLVSTTLQSLRFFSLWSWFEDFLDDKLFYSIFKFKDWN